MLILRGENGFVCHHKNSNTLDANRSVYDIFSLIFNDGAYNVKSQCFHICDINFYINNQHISVSFLMCHHLLHQWMLFFSNQMANIQSTDPSAGTNDKFWYVSSSGLVCSDGDKPEDFFLEFLEHGRVAIKGSNGKYLRGDQGGTLMGDGPTVDASCLWEY